MLSLHPPADGSNAIGAQGADGGGDKVACGLVALELHLLPVWHAVVVISGVQELPDGDLLAWCEGHCLPLHGTPEGVAEDTLEETPHASKVVLHVACVCACMGHVRNM